MLRILLCLLGTSKSFQVNISTLFPPFESYDNLPYMDTEVKNSSSLYLFFSEFDSITIYHNNKLLYTLIEPFTINLTLVPGYNELTITEHNDTRIMIGYSSLPSSSVYSVINSVPCYTGDICRTNYTTMKYIGTSLDDKVISQSAFDRSQLKVETFYNSTIRSGMNYFMILKNETVTILKVYQTENSQSLVSFTFENPGIKLYPRLSSNLTSYVIAPYLYYNQSEITFRASAGSSNCTIRYDSQIGTFIRKEVTSGSLNTLNLRGMNDTIILSTMCTGYVNSYKFSVFFKSRLRLLNHLMVYIGEPSSPVNKYFDSYTNGLIPLSFKFQWEPINFVAILSDFDYQPVLTLNLIPESEKAEILVEGFNYLKEFVKFYPLIGYHELYLTVLAEDTMFTQDYRIEYYMRSNVSTLKTLEVPEIQPVFDKQNYVYRSFIEFSSNFIPIKIETDDSLSSITIEYENQTFTENSVLETNLPFSSFSMFLFIQVKAESRSFSENYNVTFIRLDACGNGVRFSDDENCDDGNIVDGDGCSKNCKIESGWECKGGSPNSSDLCIKFPDPKDPLPICGNNKKESNEECDDSKDSQCINCKLIPSTCGNGLKEKGEECDDGNSIPNDGCSSCKKDSNGAICGDGLRISRSSEECDDGNMLKNDGCFKCKVESGWECSNTSLTTRPSPFPDTCWRLQNITEESSENDSSDNVTSNTSNITTPDTQKKTSDNNESAWDDFGYLGTASFFIVLVSSTAVAAANALIGNEKLGISVIPGIITPVWMMQLVFCFESGNEPFKNFFRSFGWSHLHFFQPVQVESRRLVDLLGTQIVTKGLFLENVQYWIFVFFLLVVVSGVCWLLLPKHSAFKIQKLIVLYYYLFSVVPLAYFAVYSFVNPDLSSVPAVISFVLAVLVLVGYFCVFAYLVFSLLCCSPEDSEISNSLTLGLKFHKLQTNTSRTNDEKYEQSLPNVVERISLEESSGCQDESIDRKLEKTRVKIQSAPLSIFKYKSPEKAEIPFLHEIEFRFLNLVLLAGLTCPAIALAAAHQIKYIGCGIAVSFLFILLVILALKSAYHYPCYNFCHIISLLMLLITSGLLISEEEEVSSISYYFVIFLVFTILCCFIHQLVSMLLLWMNVPSSEVKDLSIKAQEPSISYVRDSIPEERAPNSATINNISYEISMTVN